MPAGDAGVTWFSEMIEALRQECKPEMGQEELTALRDHLDTMPNEIRFSRGIRPPSMWWPVCNQCTQQAAPSVSVRALILALGRFGIAPLAEGKSLEKRWAKHRKQSNVNHNGKPALAVVADSGREGPAIHLHSSASETSRGIALGTAINRASPWETNT
jgi:hypothetical protein